MAALAQAQCDFLSLPSELVLEVISHLSGDHRTLCNLALTCSILQPLCEDYIYSTISLLSTDDLHAINRSIVARPARIEAVRKLDVLYKYHNKLGASVVDRRIFNQWVRHMKNLKSWHVESPYDNFKWEDGGDQWVGGDMEDFRKALENACLQQNKELDVNVGLAKLEKCKYDTVTLFDCE